MANSEPLRAYETVEDIKNLIRETFPEESATALAVAECESGFRMVQSLHQQSYGQELSFGVFQVYAPVWEDTAQRLGLLDYKTDVVQNVQLARHIYDLHGWWPWTCWWHPAHLDMQ